MERPQTEREPYQLTEEEIQSVMLATLDGMGTAREDQLVAACKWAGRLKIDAALWELVSTSQVRLSVRDDGEVVIHFPPYA